MDAFPDDEIVGNILVKTCKNLVGLSLESNFTNCVDKERLTDEGICDFIEDSNQKLQMLDLSKALSANISAKTIVNLSQLKCLTTLGLHSAQFNHFNLYFKSQEIHSVTHLSINCGFGREKFAHLKNMRMHCHTCSNASVFCVYGMFSVKHETSQQVPGKTYTQ